MKKNYLKNFNRREFLLNTSGGLAAAATLNAFSQRALAQNTNFKRCIVWYVPEGCAQQAFWPRNTGRIVINPNASVNGRNPKSFGTSIRGYINEGNVAAGMASYCLQPMAGLIDDFSMYSGFQNRGANASDPHKKVMLSALTGGTTGAGSFDQIMGRELKGNSPFSSIYLPVYGHHVLNRGAADDYLSPVHKVGGGTLGSANWNPVDVYKTVFPNGVPGPSGGNAGPAPYSDNKSRLAALASVEQRLNEVQCIGGMRHAIS